ncbi:MAG: hypothetical protein ACE15C_08530 [Phycisphaerae bacterium]
MKRSRSKRRRASAAWRDTREVKADPARTARANWLVARAELAELAAAVARGEKPAEQKIASLAKAVRADSAARAASAYDRLEALARLDELAGRTVLSRQELLDWGTMLASCGRADAVAAFERAMSAGQREAPSPSAGQFLAYAGALWAASQPAPAADACDKALAVLPKDDERRLPALKLRAAALLRSPSQRDAAGRARLLAALNDLVESDLPAEARRDALSQWVYAASDQGPWVILRSLAAQDELVKGSCYLLYSRAACRWSAMQAEALAASKPAASRPSSQAGQQVLADLDAARAAAAPGDPILPRIILLKAKVLSGQAMHDPRAALAALRDGREALAADKEIMRQASWLRVGLLMDLGMVEEASKDLAALPADALDELRARLVGIQEQLAKATPSPATGP